MRSDKKLESRRKPWLLILPFLIGLFMTIVNLSEWYRIGILKRTEGYPFGGEGPVPYFYKTPGLYALVNGVFGFVFLFLTLIVVWSFFGERRRIGLIAFALIIAVIAVDYINGRIGP